MAGGAGTGATMRANRAAFEPLDRAAMLRDVSERDTSVERFGRTLPSPFLIATIGVLEMAHTEAERAVARAVRDLDLPMIYSNQASVVPALLEHAQGAGRELREAGRGVRLRGDRGHARHHDARVAHARPRPGMVPFLRGMGIAQYTSDPVFTRLLSEPAEGSQPEPKPSFTALKVLMQLTRRPTIRVPSFKALRTGRARAAVQRFVQIYSRPSLTWADLPYLRERTSVPILLNGDLPSRRRAPGGR